MKCSAYEDQLALCLAGELNGRAALRLVKHLDRCSGCSALVDHLAETQQTVQAALRTEAKAPETLNARVMEAIAGTTPRRRCWPTVAAAAPRRWRLAMALSACALALAAYSAGHFGASRKPAGSPPMTASSRPMLDLATLTADYGHGASPSGAAVLNSDAKTLARALAPKVGETVRVANLSGRGLRLIGGSPALTQGAASALVHYDMNGQRVSIFQVDGMKLAPPATDSPKMTGHCYLVGTVDTVSYVFWCSGQTNYVMLARVEPERLFQLALYASRELDRI